MKIPNKSQKIVLVTEDNFEELAVTIQDEINDHHDTSQVQQIDYFNMNDNDGGMCSAFILFTPINYKN